MERMDAAMRGASAVGKVEMKITTPIWERTLGLNFWMSGEDRALVKIVSPAKEAGISSLRVGSNMYYYDPKVERPIKYAAAMMMQPWMGSDFTWDDMMKATSINKDYTHSLAGSVGTGQEQLKRIESVPRPDAPVTWGKIVFFVGEDNLPRKEEFYSERGELIKVLEFSEFREMGGRKFPTVWTMTPLSKEKKNHRTRITYRDMIFDTPIPESTFSLRRLTR